MLLSYQQALHSIADSAKRGKGNFALTAAPVVNSDNVAALTVGSVRLVRLPNTEGFIISIGLKREALEQLVNDALELLAAVKEKDA